MPVAYRVTPETLQKFKEPFGTLIEGSFSETTARLQGIINREKPAKIISVGDTVSRNLHKYNIVPQLAITDDKSMRKKLEPKIFSGKKLVRIKNPQGTITEEAINAIRNAVEGNEATQILVDGEEDTLTLIAVLYAPENSLVLYGQPKKGIVLVRITAEKKAEAQQILKAMKKENTE
jgi:GTP-dependent dephospho-CoA kinase